MSHLAGRRLLYGIGAQKAATTWLFEQLNAHSEVHLEPPKELHYWDTIRGPLQPVFRTQARLRAAGLDRFRGLPARLAAWRDPQARIRQEQLRDHARLLSGSLFNHDAYLAYLTRRAGAARVVGDITPGYALLSRQTFAEMAALHPEVRFVYILRDPVSRAVSGLKQSLRPWLARESLSQPQLAHLLRDVLELGHWHTAIQRSDYAATIARLEAAVPAEKILYLFYETLFTKEAMDRLAAFLGVAPFEASFKQVHAGAAKDLDALEETREELARRLSHVYAFAERRFGDALPRSWLRVQG